jgi:MFS family permease
MGIVAAPGQAAPILGPLIGGLIIDSASWRWIFYINVPLCLTALLLAWHGIPADQPRQHTRRWLDLTGLALLAPALALTIYGLSTRTHGLTLLTAGTILLVTFTVHALHTRTVTPLLELRLFTHRPFAAASALNFLSRSSIFGVMILMPLYYQQVRGHSALTTGLLLAPQSLGTMLALPHAGRLTDRIGGRPVVLAGIAITTLSALADTQIGAHPHDLTLSIALLAWGMGIAAVVVPVSIAAYQGLPPPRSPAQQAPSPRYKHSAPQSVRPYSPQSCRSGPPTTPAPQLQLGRPLTCRTHRRWRRRSCVRRAMGRGRFSAPQPDHPRLHWPGATHCDPLRPLRAPGGSRVTSS